MSTTPRSRRVIRVVLADDQPQVRAAMADLLDLEPDLELVGVASSGDEAATLCTAAAPDVAVVDVKMPGGGAAAVERIRAASPSTAVVSLSAYDDEGARRMTAEAGAAAYVVKGGRVDELLAVIRAVAVAGAPEGSGA